MLCTLLLRLASYNQKTLFFLSNPVNNICHLREGIFIDNRFINGLACLVSLKSPTQ